MRKTLFVLALLVAFVSLAFPQTHARKRKSTTVTSPGIQKVILDKAKIEDDILRTLNHHFAGTLNGGEWKKEDLKYEWVDLNKDGIDELIVQIIVEAGRLGVPFFIFKTQPVEVILGDLKNIDDDWVGDHKILNTIHKGYNDIKIYWRGQGKEEGIDTYFWNGEKYSIRKSNKK